jgi:hypothetical protein
MTADHSIWYDTGRLDYSNSLKLGYDVCAICLSPRGTYNITDRRARYNNSSCLAAFDAVCDSLQASAGGHSFAFSWRIDRTPDSNLNVTTISLPGVCETLVRNMRAAPSE